MKVSTKRWWPSHSSARRLNAVCLLMIGAAVLALLGVDFQRYPVDPWQELSRIGWGLLLPGWSEATTLIQALLQTVAFALLAVAVSTPLGLLLAMAFRWRLVRMLCAALRSVHDRV